LEAQMGEAWNLGAGETILDCVVPTDDPWQMPVCVECGQIAYRVVIVAKADGTQYRVPFCGRHFINACLKLPELNKYNRGGKLG
jgi:hypothetical protein